MTNSSLPVPPASPCLEPASAATTVIRRRLLKAGAAAPLLGLLRPAAATQESFAAAVAAFTGGAPMQTGRVRLEIARLIDNGNAVPVTVRVQSPMTADDHVTSIAIFNERNPQPDVVRFDLTPRSGKADVSTRIRLATSQQLVAVARMSDGTFWQQAVDVIVTLAACIEGEVSQVARALIHMPESARRGEKFEVRALISHVMETGYRPGADGRPVARDIIRTFSCRYNGETVFSVELHPAIAANPYIAFHTVATETGELEFRWEGDRNFSQIERRTITVSDA